MVQNKKITIPNDQIQAETQQTTIKSLVKAIIAQREEIARYQQEKITEINREKIEQIIITTDSLIKDCHMTNDFSYKRNKDFTILIYEFQRLLLRLETYKLYQTIKDIESKNEELKIKQQNLEKEHQKSKEESNNLVYTILGFIASFSIVSAAVSVIQKINKIEDVVLFMTFCVLLLITTLIGLNNFYKNNSNNKKKLQDNYFLWKVLAVLIVGILLYKGIIYIKQNQDYIFRKIGEGIGYIIKNNDET